MFFAEDLATVTHGIQLAVAPVFLLTAVSGVSCFLLALLCFLMETILATRVLRFGHPKGK